VPRHVKHVPAPPSTSSSIVVVVVVTISSSRPTTVIPVAELAQRILLAHLEEAAVHACRVAECGGGGRDQEEARVLAVER